MAGHSQFKNIMHRKGAQDAKRAKQFTKLVREIITASRLGGADPHYNARLRTAITAAKQMNMPKDRIDAAIKKGSSPTDSENFDEMRYEGYGPGGVAVIVEALTDNRNRTASDVRSAFTKHGGNMGEMGSVSFMFERVGMILYPATVAEEATMFEKALEAGAMDCSMDDSHHVIISDPTHLHQVESALHEAFGSPEYAKLYWRPTTYATAEGELAEKLDKLLHALEDLDDVQEVYTNLQ